MDASNVRVLSNFVGGAFGSKGAATSRTVWIAIAARRAAPAGQAGRHPRPGLHHRHLPRRNPPARATRRRPRRAAPGRDPRGREVTSRPSPYNVSGSRRRASSTPGPMSPPGSKSSTPTATPRASCARRPRRRTCSPSNSAWTSWPMRSAMDPVDLRQGQRRPDRPGQGPALHQPVPDGPVLRPGRRALRLGEAQSHARFDARRRLADRLGLRGGGLSGQHRPGRGRSASVPTARPRSSWPPSTSAPAPIR